MSYDGQEIAYNGSIQTAVDNMRAQAKQLESTQATIEEHVKTLAAHWSGDAQTAYHSVQQQWLKANGDLLALLYSVAQTTETGANDMIALDKQKAAQWGV